LTDGRLLEEQELKKVIGSKLMENKNLTFSCGSGITACVLALGAELAGYKNLSVYDGSWTEWGSMHKLPIEK
jgi:thiosulfate/3-mercaptopyruvate sulfurtransferase